MTNTRWNKLKQFFSNFNQNSAFFSVMLALMSFSAVVVSLMTLQEMQKQRELSMMPVIYPVGFNNLIIKTDSLCDSTVFNREIFREISEGDSILKETYKKWFKLGFINVGKGSAVNLEFEWDLNYDWMMNFLDTIQLPNWIFNLEEQKGNYIFKHILCDKGYSAVFPRKWNQDFTHLLPASNTDKEFELSVPNYILPFQLAFINTSWFQNGQHEYNCSSYEVTHQLTLTYESVNGKKHQTKYDIKFTILPSTLTYGRDKVTNKRIVEAPRNEFVLEVIINPI